MQFVYNDKNYEVIIEKKAGNKNTYIRVKKDLKVHVTTTFFTSMRSIKKLIEENYERICKMIDFQEVKVKNNTGFFYLGKKYDLIEVDGSGVSFEDGRVYVGRDADIDKWYKKQAKELFAERMQYNYERYTRKIPVPSLRIRKMTSRWGVCNIKTHVITINLELMKRDISYLDYVIIHELTHLVYGDHSTNFWRVVEENMPDYRKYREEMKEF